MPHRIVGRDRELEELEAFLDELAAGPATLVLEGEAGAGKTTLWRAGADAARARGYRVLAAQPAESETALALAGVADLLDGVLEGVLPRLPPPQREALEAALLVAAPGRAADRRTLLTAFLNVARLLASEGPLVLAVDDAQWLDPESVAALEFATRRIATEPVGLLVAVRGTGATVLGAGLTRLPAAERVRCLPVGPLELAALHRLVLDRLGGPLSRPVLRHVHETARGNPFYALELARAALRENASGEELPVPGTLLELAAGRIETLPEATRAALGALAALSQPTLRLAAAYGGEDVLVPAFAAQVLEAAGERIRFTHPLLASAALAAIPTLERRALHSRLAELVEDPEERARHLALAADGPDATVAAALDEAARRARARGAPGVAAGLYEQAQRLTPPDEPDEAAHRAVQAAFHHFESGDAARAEALLDGVIEVLPPGPARAAALTRLARVRSYEDQAAGAELYLRAIGEAAGEPSVLATAHEGVSACLFRLRERLDEAVEHAARAAALAHEQGDDLLAAEAQGSQLLAESLLGRPAAAATAEAALRLQDATTGGRLLAQPLLMVAVHWMWSDELEHAKQTFRELLSRGAEIGDESSLSYVLVLLGQLECVLGELEAAEAHSLEGAALAEQTGQRTVLAYHLGLSGLAVGLRGRVADARAAALRSLELASETGGRPAELTARAALGQLELSLGDPAAAVEWLEPAVVYARAAGFGEPGAMRMVIDLVEALLAMDRNDEAAEVLGWYEAHALRLQRTSALAACLRCRGLLAAATGDVEEGVRRLEVAVATSSRMPIPLDRARTLLGLGSLVGHAVALLLDTTVEVTLPGLFVPGLVAYRPVWTSLGVGAAEVMLVVYASFSVRKRIGTRNWRRLHWATYAIFAAASLHGLGAGTDSSSPIVLALYLTAVGSVAAATAWRFLVPPVSDRHKRSTHATRAGEA